MPKEFVTSEAADPTNLSGGPLPNVGGNPCFQELQSEIKILKDQIVVALSKAKRAAEHEEYIVELISMASEHLLCKFRKAPESLVL
jgi:hypothetical protein